jgi:hypothetical protein
MKYMIDNMLDYANIKNDKFTKNIQWFNIEKEVQSLISIHQKKADSCNVKTLATFDGFAGNMIINSDKNRIM